MCVHRGFDGIFGAVCDEGAGATAKTILIEPHEELGTLL